MTAHLSPHVPRFERAIETRGVLFGLPCYGGQMHAATYHGLRQTEQRFRELGLSFNVMTITNESLIQRARNGIAASFLASGCDRLVFIDADIGFTAEHVLRLLAHDVDVIGGMYRKKSPETVDFAANLLIDDAGQGKVNEDTGALLARHAATGFLAIKRRVFETMRDSWPHLKYRMHPDQSRPAGLGEYAWSFFDCITDPATLDYLSEDYAFCHRWRALGGEVWVDPGLILDHHGSVPLRADPMAWLLTEPA
jgi:hypothetical protein